ncbi:glycosyltransferase family 87 protein [Halobellus rufus]|uniref:glycosyltransferase family 87 protein n=1 Tax=Halobellus rufus TaxID=1448860 RepID=UPI0006787F30|nr:glycosyltransferase family 87 protein [Halobellus rufus]
MVPRLDSLSDSVLGPVSDFFGRPRIGRSARSIRAVLLFAILWGAASYERNFNPEILPVAWNPGGNLGANIRTYRYAAELAREGQSFYGVAPPELGGWAVYLYPPITVSAYYPFTLLEWMAGYWAIVALNALAGVVVAGAIVAFVDRVSHRLPWLDVGLIAGVVLLSPFTFGTMYYGNINLVVALAFVAGFLALDRDRPVRAGAAFGLAALFKLFPAVVGAWLLRTRSWRSVASATAVGVGGIAAGIVAYGWGPTVTFFTEVVPNRSETADFVGGYPIDSTYYVTVQRPLSHVLWGIFPNAPAEALLPLTLLVCAGVLAVFYRRVETLQARLIAIFATLVVTITVFPALQWYLVFLFFPMIPLWYVWDGPGRLLFLAGGAVMFANSPPGAIIDEVVALGVPNLVEVVATAVFTFATVQLYGIAIMLLACAAWTFGWHPARAVSGVTGALRR